MSGVRITYHDNISLKIQNDRESGKNESCEMSDFTSLSDFLSGDDEDDDSLSVRWLSDEEREENDERDHEIESCASASVKRPVRFRPGGFWLSMWSEDRVKRRKEILTWYRRFAIHVLGPVMTVCLVFCVVLGIAIPALFYLFQCVIFPYLPMIVQRGFAERTINIALDFLRFLSCLCSSVMANIIWGAGEEDFDYVMALRTGS